MFLFRKKSFWREYLPPILAASVLSGGLIAGLFYLDKKNFKEIEIYQIEVKSESEEPKIILPIVEVESITGNFESVNLSENENKEEVSEESAVPIVQPAVQQINSEPRPAPTPQPPTKSSNLPSVPTPSPVPPKIPQANPAPISQETMVQNDESSDEVATEEPTEFLPSGQNPFAEPTNTVEPTSPPSRTEIVRDQAYASLLAQKINQFRSEKNLSTLVFSESLSLLSADHSESMRLSGRLSHDGFVERFHASGRSACVENVGYNYDTPDSQLAGWVASSGHYENLIRADITMIGIARVGDYVTMFACR